MSTDEAYEPSSQTGIVYFLVDLLWTLLLLFIAALIVAGIVGVVRGGGNVILGGDTIGVDAQLVRSDLQGLPNGIVLTENPDVSVAVHDPTTRQTLLTTVSVLVEALLVGCILWLLRGLARSAKEGDPFAHENVGRLRGLGFALAFGGPLVAGFDSWVQDRLLYTLPDPVTNHLTRSGFSIPWELVLAGMGAFILASVFAYGVRLREDVEATV